MGNPFGKDYNEATDDQLVEAALGGSREALEKLLQRHQHFIYNVAHKMVLSPFDAQDITQEVLIKVITKLSQFNGKSAFRTWLYRIVFNHVLEMKRYGLEEAISTFEQYGGELESIPDRALSAWEQQEWKEWVEEAKLACMAGMFLCLSREQRMVYVLGEIFGADQAIGAELLSISKDNFRQRLSRARKDLYQFMQRKCGLLNKANPCRCDKKTKGFIQAGWVDPAKAKFNTAYVRRISDLAGPKSRALDETLQARYAFLFRELLSRKRPTGRNC